MKTLSALLASVLVTGLMTQPVYAGDGDKHEFGEKVAKELGLTDAQKKQVEEIQAKHKPQIKEKRTALKAARKDLRSAMKAPDKGPGYQSTLQSKFKTVQSLQSEMATARFQMALEMREVLTPEQIGKMKGVMGEMRHKFKKIRKHHGGGDGDSDEAKDGDF